MLLIEPHDKLRETRASKLLAWGYQVSAMADAEAAPAAFPPRLYDVIVVSAGERCLLPPEWYAKISRNGWKPVVVVIAKGPFRLGAAAAPALVISDPTERAVEDKLQAFLAAVGNRKPIPA